MARIDPSRARALATKHRREAIYVGMALALVVASLAAGITARGRIAPANLQRNRLRSTEQDIATFRSAFRDATLEERSFRFPDSLSVAVAHDARFSIAQRIAERAEQLGLTDVRVRFAPADSSEPPASPELSATHIAVADYAIGVDCRGDFSALLSLVEALPPSVALQRMDAARAPSGANVGYHLTLAVFESASDTTTGTRRAGDVEQVAQLLPYARPPRDSELALAVPATVDATHDPFVVRSMTRILAEAPATHPASRDTARATTPLYRVTTTLMAGSRRAALINDQLIYVGESLPDGSKLTAVERDRIVVTDHSGVAHSVAVAKEGDS
jgi:hypothetical protein